LLTSCVINPTPVSAIPSNRGDRRAGNVRSITGVSEQRSRSAALVALAVAVVVAGSVILLTRAHGSSSSPGSPAAAVSVAATTGIVAEKQPAPLFSGTAVDGTRVDLGALRGRVVVVNFFASWCSNCREEEPRLQATATSQAARGLSVIGVNYRETGDATAFLHDLKVTYPALLDPESRIGQAYGVTDLPVTVYIDRQGTVARVIHGQLTDTTLDGIVAQLLG